MALYKYETHIHTSQGSACSMWRGSAIAERLHELGYSGVFITDHFFNGNSCVDRSLPWDVKIHLHCQGYEECKKRGDELGLDVWLGWEFANHGTELLTYGLDKQFLLDHPEIMEMPLERYADLVHENGGFIVHAHPFREAFYLPPYIRLYPHKVDGVEAINCGNSPEANERAQWYAKSYGIPMSAGSDGHHVWSYPSGGIGVEEKFTCAHDYLKALQSNSIAKLYEPSKDAHLPWPADADKYAVRHDIELLPEELKAKAKAHYANK